MYWNLDETRSHNCLNNFIIGNRGAGKTYGFKRWAIRDFLKTGAQFIYVRRYRTELAEVARFFDDIRNDPICEGHTLTVKGLTFLVDDKLAGYAVALSTSKIKKSTSYALVNKIGFDEFIIEKGVYHYLPDETKAFAEFYITVSRYRPVVVFYLANSITMTNPYFLRYDIQLPYGSKFYKRGEYLLQLVEDQDFIDHVNSTRVGRMLRESDPSYAKYAVDNAFMLDNRNFVEKKTPRARHSFSMRYMDRTFGVWVDYAEGKIFVSDAIDPCCRLVYAITTSDHTPNTMLLKHANKAALFKVFLDNYKLGNVRFESIKIKNICQEIIKLTMT